MLNKEKTAHNEDLAMLGLRTSVLRPIYRVFAFVRGKAVCCVHAIMSGKTEILYRKFWEKSWEYL
jgi:hypothetical protein